MGQSGGDVSCSAMTSGQAVTFCCNPQHSFVLSRTVSRDIARSEQLVSMECLSLPYPVMEEHAVPPATLGPDPEE